MKCMMVCREDNSCVENSNGVEGFANGHIFSVVTAQTIGKPIAVSFPASSTLHTPLDMLCSTRMLVPCMSQQNMGLACQAF